MQFEDLLAAANQGSTPPSAAQHEEDEFQGLRLPPIHAGSPNSTLPPQLQRLALSPEEAASHQRQSSSTSSLDETDLYGASSGSKLSTLAALSAMEGWPAHSQPHRQRTLPSLTSEYTAATATLPSSSHGPSPSRSAYARYPPPISVPSSAPALHWPTSQPYPAFENGSRSLPSTSAPFSSYPTAGPSSAPPRTYDVSESIIESVEHLRRRQQAMLSPETEDGYGRFAPRSQRACVNCQKAKKRCVPTESGMRPCDRCVRLRLQASCSDAPRKSDFDYNTGQQQQPPPPPRPYDYSSQMGLPTWNQ